VVTEKSNKGHFAIRNTWPITRNVRWYIYVPETCKGLSNMFQASVLGGVVNTIQF
jgi:hypothetical protein